MNNNLTILDVMNVVSLYLSMLNYGENLNQSDKAEIMQAINKQTQDILNEIHQHLIRQDKLLRQIQEELNNDHR